MLLSLYPNLELRARVPTPPRVDRTDPARGARLVNRPKLAIKDLPPPEVCRYPQCPWPRPGYGGEPKGVIFSVYARRQIARSGGCFSIPDRNRLVFLTGTLPGSTKAAMDAIASYSSWVVHETLSRIPQSLKIRGAEQRWQWVWEYQSRGALHFHAVYELETPELAQSLIEAWPQIWGGVLLGLSKRSGVDVFARSWGGTWANRPEKWRIDAQLARGSAQQYLSKYIDKDSSKKVGFGVLPPVRWYGCSRLLLSDLRSQTVIFSPVLEDGQKQWEFSESDSEVLSFLRRVSTKVVSFCDKVKTGFTVVHYVARESVDLVTKYLREREIEVMTKVGQEKNSEVVCRIGEKARRTKSIEWVIESSWLTTQFIEYLSTDEYEWFYKYLSGEEVPLFYLSIVHKLATNFLINIGCLSVVNPAPASVAGVDDSVSAIIESGGGNQLVMSFSELPY